MKPILISLILFVSTSLFASNDYYKGNTTKEAPFYGAPIKSKEVTPLKKVLANIENYQNKPVLIEAKVAKVCQKKGCWMQLKTDDVRVKFQDYSFFVPMSLVGKKVLVEGTIKEKKLTKKEATHYAKDAGKKSFEKLKLKEFRMLASGVRPL